MLELEFGKFFNQNYKAEEYHQLYVVLNASQTVLYVGITKRNVWERWFGFGGHMYFDGKSLRGTSAVGQKIEDNFPESENWIIQLWTLEDCISFCNDVLPFNGKPSIEMVEDYMIQKLSPALNVANNQQPGKDTTPKSQKEIQREKELDDAFRKIFGNK